MGVGKKCLKVKLHTFRWRRWRRHHFTKYKCSKWKLTSNSRRFSCSFSPSLLLVSALFITIFFFFFPVLRIKFCFGSLMWWFGFKCILFWYISTIISVYFNLWILYSQMLIDRVKKRKCEKESHSDSKWKNGKKSQDVFTSDWISLHL